jgi:hypothetical protein
MPRLSPQPVDVQMQFVLPDVKKGDYYNFRNPLTGRTMYVYPFMMGERYFPAVDRLGDNGDPDGLHRARRSGLRRCSRRSKTCARRGSG